MGTNPRGSYRQRAAVLSARNPRGNCCTRLRDHSQLQDVFRNRILRRVLAEKTLKLLLSTLCPPPGPPLARRLSRSNERASLSQPEAIRSGCNGVVPQSQDVGGVLYVLFCLLASVIYPQITSAPLTSENCPPS